ncbi:unnamed protein product [Rhizoctonia solani]|uniref:Uncharacterized protein n=1 Tax=Rhizoctonia solani TaxID=456999 RepID=A0A8H3H8E6_9AGAM|nr:unnamed protein product [Rhizoctonia solani]
MWQLTRVDNIAGSELQFSDEKELFAVRGEVLTSSRLVISGQGFIDFTTLEAGHATRDSHSPTTRRLSYVDLNHQSITISSSGPSSLIRIYLILPGDGSFRFSANRNRFISGKLKPLPRVSKADADYFQKMIDRGPVPYPPLASEGKTHDKIRELGFRYFPFSPHSFQLAMAMYDWTTASFARMVLMKMFEYTAISESPRPLDKASVASAIFNSNWLSFTPDNPDYMRSFLMAPAESEQEVLDQLEAVLPQLQHLSTVENRLLSIAASSMPRTPKASTPRLYSGQLDMHQFGLDRFGVQFTQCPLNAGPPGVSLRVDLEKSLETFLRPGSSITTKQVWSFSDSLDIAMSYQNGIVLVVQPPDDGSLVWETPCYVTPLSCEADKVEWIFPPGTTFTVLAIDRWEVHGSSVLGITLKQCTSSNQADATQPFCDGTPLKHTPPSFTLTKSDRSLPHNRLSTDISIANCGEWALGSFSVFSILFLTLFCGLFYYFQRA